MPSRNGHGLAGAWGMKPDSPCPSGAGKCFKCAYRTCAAGLARRISCRGPDTAGGTQAVGHRAPVEVDAAARRGIPVQPADQLLRDGRRHHGRRADGLRPHLAACAGARNVVGRRPVLPQCAVARAALLRHVPDAVRSARARRDTIPFPDWIKATLGLALPIMANVAEIVRGAVQSIPTAQWEAARSLAFSRRQTLWKIILPQCVKRMLPPWMNWYAILTMATTLASIVGVSEVMTSHQSDHQRRRPHRSADSDLLVRAAGVLRLLLSDRALDAPARSALRGALMDLNEFLAEARHPPGAARASAGDDRRGVAAPRAEVSRREDEEPVSARQEGTAPFSGHRAARQGGRHRRAGGEIGVNGLGFASAERSAEVPRHQAGIGEPAGARQRRSARPWSSSSTRRCGRPTPCTRIRSSIRRRW